MSIRDWGTVEKIQRKLEKSKFWVIFVEMMKKKKLKEYSEKLRRNFDNF